MSSYPDPGGGGGGGDCTGSLLDCEDPFSPGPNAHSSMSSKACLTSSASSNSAFSANSSSSASSGGGNRKMSDCSVGRQQSPLCLEKWIDGMAVRHSSTSSESSGYQGEYGGRASPSSTASGHNRTRRNQTSHSHRSTSECKCRRRADKHHHHHSHHHGHHHSHHHAHHHHQQQQQHQDQWRSGGINNSPSPEPPHYHRDLEREERPWSSASQHLPTCHHAQERGCDFIPESLCALLRETSVIPETEMTVNHQRNRRRSSGSCSSGHGYYSNGAESSASPTALVGPEDHQASKMAGGSYRKLGTSSSSSSRPPAGNSSCRQLASSDSFSSPSTGSVSSRSGGSVSSSSGYHSHHSHGHGHRHREHHHLPPHHNSGSTSGSRSNSSCRASRGTTHHNSSASTGSGNRSPAGRAGSGCRGSPSPGERASSGCRSSPSPTPSSVASPVPSAGRHSSELESNSPFADLMITAARLTTSPVPTIGDVDIPDYPLEVNMPIEQDELNSQNKPQLKKSYAVDIGELEGKKKMERGISHATANETLVSAARTVVQKDFSARGGPQFSTNTSGNLREGCISPGSLDLETPIYTFTLPDLTCFSEDYRGFLEKDLIELSALISLEQSGRLNWWADTGTCQRLWPLATTGDGNCLLHAASLGMWGFHDRLLTLRKALYNFLTSSPAVDGLYRRWRWQAAQINRQSGLTLTESEWSEEWNSVIKLASSQPRAQETQPTRRRSRLSTVSEENSDSNPLYESLEEVHVLALAHVLKRPIIIVADLVLKDAFGEALAPIPFGGIYLPLEYAASECHKVPLLLTYDSGHFSALVSMEPQAQNLSPLPCVIPVTDSNHSILPLQFSIDPGLEVEWGSDDTNDYLVSQLVMAEEEKIGVLREYLDIVQVPLPACFLDPSLRSTPELISPDSVDSGQSLYEDPEPAGPVYPPKSKTAKQIQSVAKQFGSIGKKLKRNLGTMTRLARTGSFRALRKDLKTVSQTTRLQSCRIVSGHQDHILAALIHTQKTLPYHQEMVNNYLQEARLRFDKDKELKLLQAEERREREREREQEVTQEQNRRLHQLAMQEGSLNCINADCKMLGNASTSYLCQNCYQKQIAEERDSPLPGNGSSSFNRHASHQHSPNLNSGNASTLGNSALYGSGRSRFYVNNDAAAYDSLKSVPQSRAPTARTADRSLYLVNSTFYRDRVPDLIVPVPKTNPDPMPIVPVDMPPPKAPVVEKTVSKTTSVNDMQPPKAPQRRKPVESGHPGPRDVRAGPHRGVTPSPPHGAHEGRGPPQRGGATPSPPVHTCRRPSGGESSHSRRTNSPDQVDGPIQSESRHRGGVANSPNGKGHKSEKSSGKWSHETNGGTSGSGAKHTCGNTRENGMGMKVMLPGMVEGKPCKTPACHFFGTAQTNFYCSKCYRESQRVLQLSRV